MRAASTLIVHCEECGDTLTPEEAFHYENSCEECERAWMERVRAWRAGAHDRELDEYFEAYPDGRVSSAPRVVH